MYENTCLSRVCVRGSQDMKKKLHMYNLGLELQVIHKTFHTVQLFKPLIKSLPSTVHNTKISPSGDVQPLSTINYTCRLA